MKQAEESYFKQKSRIKWLKEGDQNTKYFHGMMAARQKRNTISVLTDLEGHKLISYDQMSNEAVTFFQKLIGTVDEKVEGCPQPLLQELLGVSLPEEAIPELIRQVTPEEVKSSMFSIGSDKSPGLDGYTSHFFKAAWHIVGDDVEKAIISFFQTSRLIPAFNSTIMALIPKCQNPNNIKEFRPISCCSVVYKGITKIIATRMKKFMPTIIGSNQSTFIFGRSITNNILMAHELVRGYGRSTLSPRYAIKIDLQKTFDSLDWNFILDILTVLKFSSLFIEWIRSYLTGARFSISLNGILVGYFKGARGVRQGDPLSPYLFVLAINVLSKMLDAAANYEVFKFHPKCKKVQLTHLCFADDLLIFAKGDKESVIGVQKVL